MNYYYTLYKTLSVYPKEWVAEQLSILAKIKREEFDLAKIEALCEEW